MRKVFNMILRIIATIILFRTAIGIVELISLESLYFMLSLIFYDIIICFTIYNKNED